MMRGLVRRLAGIILFTSLVPFQAMAQQLLPENIDVVIEQLSESAARCNISREGIDASTKSALRYNRIGYSKDSQTYIYVNANVLNITGNSCFVALDVSIRQWDTMPDTRGGHISGTFEYCNAGLIQTGPDAANRLYASTKNAIDQCLASVEPSPNGAAVNRILRQYLNERASEGEAPKP